MLREVIEQISTKKVFERPGVRRDKYFESGTGKIEEMPGAAPHLFSEGNRLCVMHPLPVDHS